MEKGTEKTCSNSSGGELLSSSLGFGCDVIAVCLNHGGWHWLAVR